MYAYLEDHQLHLITSENEELVYDIFEVQNMLYLRLANGEVNETNLHENEVYLHVPKVCNILDLVPHFSKVGHIFSLRMLITTSFYSYDLCTITYRTLEASRRCMIYFNYEFIYNAYGYLLPLFVRGYRPNSHLVLGPLSPTLPYTQLKDAIERYMGLGLIKFDLMCVPNNPYEGIGFCMYRSGTMAFKALENVTPWLKIDEHVIFVYWAEPLMNPNRRRNLVIKHYPGDVTNMEFYDLLKVSNIDLKTIYSFEMHKNPINEVVISFTRPAHCLAAFDSLKNSQIRGHKLHIEKRSDAKLFHNPYFESTKTLPPQFCNRSLFSFGANTKYVAFQ